MALVERVEDEVLVEPDLLGARPGAVGEARAGRVGEGRRARRDPDDVRRGLGLGRGVPERAGGVEGVAEGRALGLEALREEGVAGAQLADRPREGRLGLGEEHRRPPGSGADGGARVGRRVAPGPPVSQGMSARGVGRPAPDAGWLPRSSSPGPPPDLPDR